MPKMTGAKMVERTAENMTDGPVPVDKVLDGAKGLREVLVLGVDANGKSYAACSTGDMQFAVYLCELFKHKLLSGEYVG